MPGSRSPPADGAAFDLVGAASAASFSLASRRPRRARGRKQAGRDAVSSASSRKGPPRVTTSILLPAILIAALLDWAVMLFNRLVRLRNQVRPAWTAIERPPTRRTCQVPTPVA